MTNLRDQTRAQQRLDRRGFEIFAIQIQSAHGLQIEIEVGWRVTEDEVVHAGVGLGEFTSQRFTQYLRLDTSGIDTLVLQILDEWLVSGNNLVHGVPSRAVGSWRLLNAVSHPGASCM